MLSKLKWVISISGHSGRSPISHRGMGQSQGFLEAACDPGGGSLQQKKMFGYYLLPTMFRWGNWDWERPTCWKWHRWEQEDSLLTAGFQIPIPVFLHPINPPPKLPPWPSCLPKLHVISDDAFLVHSTLLFEDVVSVTIPLEITAKTLENVSLWSSCA